MPTRLTRISAAVAVLLALAAGLGLALWPCAYRSSVGESGPGGALQERQVCATLVEVHGVGALVVLALPVLLAGIGLLGVLAGRRGLLATVTIALIACCGVALASVGMLYLPAAGALVVAWGSWRQARPATGP
jgi:hypothetical protein